MNECSYCKNVFKIDTYSITVNIIKAKFYSNKIKRSTYIFKFRKSGFPKVGQMVPLGSQFRNLGWIRGHNLKHTL